MDHAQRTQESYDRIAGEFLERQRSASVLRGWMQRFAARLSNCAVVADLGAGPCHQSAMLRELGLRVISVDRSVGMLTVRRGEFPGPRVRADLRALPFRSQSFGGAWASASLLHLDREELAPALTEVARVLVPHGALFVSLKAGSGERYETSRYGVEVPRWFTYWAPADVDAALDAAGFEVLEAETRPGTNETWILRIARRSPL